MFSLGPSVLLYSTTIGGGLLARLLAVVALVLALAPAPALVLALPLGLALAVAFASLGRVTSMRGAFLGLYAGELD